MKKALAIIALAVAAMTFASCSSEEKDPVRVAVMEKIMKDNPQVLKFYFTKFEKTKDVTLAEELDRRESLFKTQEKVCKKKVAEYKAKHMRVQELEDKVTSAGKILGRIEEYRTNHAAQLDSIIYSIYTFSGSGKTSDGGQVVTEDRCVTLSPDCTVYRLQSGGNPYKGMSVAIPLYREEILGRESVVEE